MHIIKYLLGPLLLISQLSFAHENGKAQNDLNIQLIQAALEGDNPGIEQHIKSGADRFNSAIAAAASFKQVSSLKILIEKSNNSDLTNALIILAVKQDRDAVKLLIKMGADDFNLNIAMIESASRGEKDAVELLIQTGANNFAAALAIAAVSKRNTTLKLLIERSNVDDLAIALLMLATNKENDARKLLAEMAASPNIDMDIPSPNFRNTQEHGPQFFEAPEADL